MNRRSFSHQALHGWRFHENPTYCRHENMAYKGNLLISYNTVIGVYDKRHQFTILTPHFYSNTTAHHRSFYAQASPYSVFYLSIPGDASLEFSDFPEVNDKDKYSFKTKSLRDIIIYNINKVKRFIKDVKSDKYIDNSYKNALRSDREFCRSLISNVSSFYDYLIRNKILKSNKKLLKDIEVLSNALAKRKRIVNAFWSQSESKQLGFIKKGILLHIRSSLTENETMITKTMIDNYVKNKAPCNLYHLLRNYNVLNYEALNYIKRLACIKDKSLKHVEKDICFFEQITPSKEKIVSSKGFSVTMKTVKFLIKTFWRNQGRDITFKQIKIDNYHFNICVYPSHVRIGCHIIPYFVIDNLKKQIEEIENQGK